MGQWRRFDGPPATSPPPRSADIRKVRRHVSNWPQPDVSLIWWYGRGAEIFPTKPVDFYSWGAP